MLSQPNPSARRGERNHVFDLLRLFFATLVLLAHAPEIQDGDSSREIVARLTHTTVTFGTVGLDGFFLLSGFLILQSWLSGPRLGSFLRKRALRIVPGYLAAVLLSTLVIGLVAPAAPGFFHHLGRPYFDSVLTLSTPVTPQTYPGVRTLPPLNGPLYTIAYEFRCYLLVALFGVLGLYRWRLFWPLATIALLATALTPAAQNHLSWHHLMIYLGEPSLAFRLTPIFFVGGCFFLFRDRIPYHPALAAAAAVLIALTLRFAPTYLEQALYLFGGYLLFFLGRHHFPALAWMRHIPDISFGVYLYGWPVECLWLWRHPNGSPWLTFLVALPISYLLGWLSWHLVERPSMRFKRRSPTELPAP